MVCRSGYIKFFCRRAYAGIKREPRINAFWLFGGAVFLDISREIIIKEAMALGTIIPGVFTYGDLLKMKISEYETVLEEANKIKKQREPDG